jgi:SSS family solute:Na+ symporter
MLLPVFLLIYLGVNLGIGWWSNRRVKNTGDFVLAGRRLPFHMAVTATFATWFGAETVLGSSGEFAQHGLIGVVEDPFGAALCLLLVALFYAKPLYRMNLLTFCDYFKVRFGPRAEFISAFLMIPSYFGWVAAQLVAMGLVLNLILGVPVWAGILISTVIVLLYTYWGGMWAVTLTDFIQTIVIISCLLIVTILVVQKAGGLASVLERTPKGFFHFLPERNVNSWLEYFAAWFTLGLGSIPAQDVFQRVMSSRSERVAVRATFTASGLYLVVGAMPLLIALAACLHYPDLNPGDPQKMLPLAVLRSGGLWLEVLFFGALLSAVMSTASGTMLAPASVLGENILRPRMPHVTDKRMLGFIRLSLAGVALVSMVMALSGASIYDLVAQSSAFTLVSLFVPLTAGIYWKRASARAANWSMIAGMVFWLPAEIWGSPIPSIFPGLLASLLVMVIFSLIWPHPQGDPHKAS